MSLNQTYFEHLTAGSDRGRDTMDLLCDKTLKELPSLTLKAIDFDNNSGVLVLADFYKHRLSFYLIIVTLMHLKVTTKSEQINISTSCSNYKDQ